MTSLRVQDVLAWWQGATRMLLNVVSRCL